MSFSSSSSAAAAAVGGGGAGRRAPHTASAHVRRTREQRHEARLTVNVDKSRVREATRASLIAHSAAMGEPAWTMPESDVLSEDEMYIEEDRAQVERLCPIVDGERTLPYAIELHPFTLDSMRVFISSIQGRVLARRKQAYDLVMHIIDYNHCPACI